MVSCFEEYISQVQPTYDIFRSLFFGVLDSIKHAKRLEPEGEEQGRGKESFERYLKYIDGWFEEMMKLELTTEELKGVMGLIVRAYAQAGDVERYFIYLSYPYSLFLILSIIKI